MDPLTQDINALVADHLTDFKWWGYDRIFSKTEDVFSAQWILDGMTPVALSSVIDALKRRGVNLASVESRIMAAEKAKEDEHKRCMGLRVSAKAKLTPEEIEACGL